MLVMRTRDYLEEIGLEPSVHYHVPKWTPCHSNAKDPSNVYKPWYQISYVAADNAQSLFRLDSFQLTQANNATRAIEQAATADVPLKMLRSWATEHIFERQMLGALFSYMHSYSTDVLGAQTIHTDFARPELAKIFLLETGPYRKAHPLSRVTGYELTRGILATMATLLPSGDSRNEGTEAAPILGTDFVYLIREVNRVKGQHFMHTTKPSETPENLIYSLMVIQYMNQDKVSLRYRRVSKRLRDCIVDYANACVVETNSPWRIDESDREFWVLLYDQFERDYFTNFALSISRLLKSVIIEKSELERQDSCKIIISLSNGRRLECGTLRGETLDDWKHAWGAEQDIAIARCINTLLERNVLKPGQFPELREHLTQAYALMRGVSVEEQEGDEDYTSRRKAAQIINRVTGPGKASAKRRRYRS